MDKFGLFDVISKLSFNENAINSIVNVAKTVINSKENKNLNAKRTDNKKPQYNTKAIQDLIKRHDDLSKKIDEQNKNIRPKN